MILETDNKTPGSLTNGRSRNVKNAKTETHFPSYDNTTEDWTLSDAISIFAVILLVMCFYVLVS